jgi:hypothetical protein
LIPFDYNTNKKFTTNVFQSVGKKISYLCFQAGSATGLIQLLSAPAFFFVLSFIFLYFNNLFTIFTVQIFTPKIVQVLGMVRGILELKLYLIPEFSGIILYKKKTENDYKI